MGGIGGLIGLGGGQSGTGISGPQSVPLQSGTNATQLQNSYDANQSALSQQQNLLNAIQQQNGLGNQSQVYGQLQGVVNGTGPNPAQAQLAQATGANVQNQAALMAGQRGAGANVGLMARQAAQQGAALQQNAVGQAATLQANQSLNALGAAGSLANQQAANQIGATSANTQAQQSEQNVLQGANTAYNNAEAGMQSNINSVNGGLANTQLQGQQGLIGGLLGGAGQAAHMGAEGGVVPTKMADGGAIQIQSPTMNGPQSSFGQFLSSSGGSMGSVPGMESSGPNLGAQSLQSGLKSGISSAFAKGKPSAFATNTIDSGTGATDIPQVGSGTMVGAHGGNVGSKLKGGGHVPGKPKVKGNSYANDNVKALLSPGELVVDRETMNSGGKAGEAARFLAAVIAAKKRGAK